MKEESDRPNQKTQCEEKGRGKSKKSLQENRPIGKKNMYENYCDQGKYSELYN